MLGLCGFGDAVFGDALNGVQSHATNANDHQLSVNLTTSPAGTEMVETRIQGAAFRMDIVIYQINKVV